uniref:Uncharacterized protein n=1 Tax=Timema bartmani TaxID=61472 RepID=A0A7R9EW71_9NEOP|nr:unnamed protein product [Timema bartmani]
MSRGLAMTNLRRLNLNSTKLSAEMFESLRKSLPVALEIDVRYTEACCNSSMIVQHKQVFQVFDITNHRAERCSFKNCKITFSHHIARAKRGKRPLGVVVSEPGYEPRSPGFDSRLVLWVSFPKGNGHQD